MRVLTGFSSRETGLFSRARTASRVAHFYRTLLFYCSKKKKEQENAEESIILSAIVCPPSDLQTFRVERECVFFRRVWRSCGGGNRREVPAKQRTKKKLGEGGFFFGNHGNQTRSLRKLFFFLDLVKAGVCINAPTFPYQRCRRLSCHVAILFISLLSSDWLLLQGQH